MSEIEIVKNGIRKDGKKAYLRAKKYGACVLVGNTIYRVEDNGQRVAVGSVKKARARVLKKVYTF